MIIKCNQLNDSIELAKRLALRLTCHDIVLLSGDLGAGKTTFTKAIACAIGITATVTSPTFALMKEYSGAINLYHYDMYRIESVGEIEELGISEYLDYDGLAVIEWNKYKQFPPHKRVINITISKVDDDENARIYEILGINIE